MGKETAFFIAYCILLQISTVVLIPTSVVRNRGKIRTYGKPKDVLRTLIKSPNKLEMAEKKSDVKKKTSISINGNVVPIAGMAETDKTVHVTVQNNGASQPGVAQPLIQEVVPGTTQNTVPQVGASPPLGMSPPVNVGMSPPVNVGMSPPVNVGMSPPTNVGLSPPVNVGLSPPVNVGLSPPINIGMSPPTHIGMSPPVQQGLSPPTNIGMSPPVQQGMSPPQMVGQPAVGMTQGTNIPVNVVSNNQSPLPSSLVPVQTINNPQITNGQPACQNTNNNLQSSNLVHLDKNSEGQLIYKPVAC